MCRLLDCLQEDGKLFLVFEFVDKDLKRFMEHKLGTLEPALIKVSAMLHASCVYVLYACTRLLRCCCLSCLAESALPVAQRTCLFSLSWRDASVWETGSSLFPIVSLRNVILTIFVFNLQRSQTAKSACELEGQSQNRRFRARARVQHPSEEIHTRSSHVVVPST